MKAQFQSKQHSKEAVQSIGKAVMMQLMSDLWFQEVQERLSAAGDRWEMGSHKVLCR